MEEEERPRKFPKLDYDASNDSQAQGEAAPTDATTDRANDTNDTTETDAIEHPNIDEQKEGESEPKALSKNQLKKLLRQQRWDEQREERKAWKKEKAMARKQRKRKALQKASSEQGPGAGPILTAKEYQIRSILVPVTLVIDCSFDDLMLDKERKSLGSQITRSYSDNSRAPYRGHLVISTFDSLLKERFDTVLAKHHENWKGVHFMQEDFVHAAEQAKDWMKGLQGGRMEGVFKDKADATLEDGEIIYLSSDSPNTLTELKPYSTYIVGGLVDKNRHKGICYKRACERGIKTAKLPIGQYLHMSTRPVLATNHVVEIMIKWLELGDWGEAFLRVMPKRKGGVLKQSGGEDRGETAQASELEEGSESPADEQEPAEGNTMISKQAS